MRSGKSVSNWLLPAVSQRRRVAQSGYAARVEPRSRLVARIEGARAIALIEGEALAIEGASEGAIVLVRRRGERAEVLKTLAEPESALAESHQIAAQAGFDVAFPDRVIDETDHWQRASGIDDRALEDLTALPFVTIDSPHARDLDQAVHVGARGREGWTVSYAIADASYYVRRGSALWDEALRRGASYYLPGLSIPMLPRPLSEGLVSLNAAVPRRALVFVMELDARGACASTRLVRARVRSRAKLSFADVQALHDRADHSPLAGTEVESSLRALGAAGEAMIASVATDVVRYRRREIDVAIGGAKGERYVALDGVRSRVELWNERISLLCNAEGARVLLEASREARGVRPIYRVHPEPEPEKVVDLEATIEAIVAVHGLPRERWLWRRSEQSLAEYVAALPEHGANEARVAAAIERKALLVNVRSSYASQAGKHHGTGFDPYARFSAPMREVVGVYLHEEAIEVIEGRAGAPGEEALREHVIARANESKEVQRRIHDRVNRRVIDRLFAPELARPRRDRKAWNGTVMGVDPRRVYLQLDETGIDVKVYLRDLGRAWRAFLVCDPLGVVLSDRASGQARVRVGDAFAVRVLERDETWDRWVLEPVEARA